MVGEMSVPGNVLVGKCPVGEVSGRGIVRSGKCPSGKCTVGKLSYNFKFTEEVSSKNFQSISSPFHRITFVLLQSVSNFLWLSSTFIASVISNYCLRCNHNQYTEQGDFLLGKSRELNQASLNTFNHVTGNTKEFPKEKEKI